VEGEISMKKGQNLENMNLHVVSHIRKKPRAVKLDTCLNKNQASDEMQVEW